MNAYKLKIKKVCKRGILRILESLNHLDFHDLLDLLSFGNHVFYFDCRLICTYGQSILIGGTHFC
jgi:hypothetical protein